MWIISRFYVAALAPRRRGSCNSPATRNGTRDPLIAAAVYSQMLYQLSYSRLAIQYKTVLALARLATCPRIEVLPAPSIVGAAKKGAILTHGWGCGLYHKLEFAAYTIPEGAAKERYVFAPLYHWLHGVTVITLDSESSDRGSNPREAYAFAGHCHLYIGVFSCSWRAVHMGKQGSRVVYLFGVLVAGHKKLRVVSASRSAHPHSPWRQRVF
jgi:hypothetical protein